jgi:phosphatidylglycerophosphate synthase
MQAIIAIPPFNALIGTRQAGELLSREVAGIPLLKRVVLTAMRAGATEILLIRGNELGPAFPLEFGPEISPSGFRLTVIQFSNFDPNDSSNWTALERYVKDQFLWIPWNWVTTKQFLKDLPPRNAASVDWAAPALVSLHQDGDDAAASLPFAATMGVRISSQDSIARAERFLVAYSGKVLDGIHTSFNRKLCRPFVRLLSHTSITPNEVTFGGVLVSILSAFAFARGGYLYSVLGALLFYIAGLFDEMDGMVARIKFAESPRGTWLEGFADGLSYLLLFGGITIGLSHRYGRPATWMGLFLLVGAILSLVATSLQRRRATTADRPNEYLGRMYQLLDKDSGNWISRVVRQLQAFVRRGILVHYVVIFTLIGALPLLFTLATLGANMTWILTLYFNRRFFAQSFHQNATLTRNPIKETL